MYPIIPKPFIDPYGYLWTYDTVKLKYATLVYNGEEFEILETNNVAETILGDTIYEYHLTRGITDHLRKLE